MEQQTHDTHEGGDLGLKSVLEKVTMLGAAQVKALPDRDNAVQIYSNERQRHFHLRVRSRHKEADWQIPVREGRGQDDMVIDNEFWVLVDFGATKDSPYYYVIPGQWLRRKIHDEHQHFLNELGEIDLEASETRQHLVRPAEVEQWRERWDQLGL